MKLNTRILLGFLVIVLLIIAMAYVNYTLNNDRLEKTNQIKDVEAPLELMVEQVIGYDAMLTGAAHAALLHAQKGDFQAVNERKAYYDDTGGKLDNLLKNNAKALLEKSKRAQEIKNNVSVILKRLDEVNIALVDLETKAFDAMEKNNTGYAYSLIVVGDYNKYKSELVGLYNEWNNIEKEATLKIRNEIIQESLELNLINLIFSIAIIILAIIISFLISLSISNPIKKLKNNVDEITKGKLDIQLEKTSINEIQGLTDSLNRILATMKLAILRTGLSKGELGLGEAIKAKEEAEDRYKILYESSSDAIMTLEPPSWKFTSGNKSAIKMFNAKDEEEFISKGPWDVSPKKQPDGSLSSDSAKKMIEKAMKEGSSYFKWTHKRLNGEEFPANVLLSRFKLNGKDVLQATVRDLSKEFKKK